MSERQRWAAHVLRTLSVLIALESEIVRLTYFSRLSVAAIASRLVVPALTVKSVLADAMCTLGFAFGGTP